MTRGAAFDVQAVCSGFIYAIAVADNFIKAGQAKTCLVVGAETFSRILDWNDRTTAVLFGDGAGAFVLTAGQGQGNANDRGVLTTHLFSDGRLHDLLYVDGGPSKTMTTGFLRMEGREVFRHAVTKISDAIETALKSAGLTASDIDWFVPHQANQRILDWNDRTTAVLFGDGAGAFVLSAGQGQGNASDRGVLTTHLFSDGRLHDLLYVDGGPSKTMTTGFLRMEGREVFRHAVTKISDAIETALKAAGLTASDIDWFVPHQANQRILDGTARKVGVHPSRVISSVAMHANTSAASVPLALVAAINDGRIKQGQLVLLEAMGGGFTWGSALIRW